jgi:hypothetical protein
MRGRSWALRANASATTLALRIPHQTRRKRAGAKISLPIWAGARLGPRAWLALERRGWQLDHEAVASLARVFDE